METWEGSTYSHETYCTFIAAHPWDDNLSPIEIYGGLHIPAMHFRLLLQSARMPSPEFESRLGHLLTSEA